MILLRQEGGIYMAFLLNAFSANMLGKFPATVNFSEISLEEAKALLASGFESAVGHQATAEVLSQRLGLQVEAKRVNVALAPGDTAVLAQVRLPRLEEGQILTAEQVAAAPVSFILVRIAPDNFVPMVYLGENFVHGIWGAESMGGYVQ